MSVLKNGNASKILAECQSKVDTLTKVFQNVGNNVTWKRRKGKGKDPAAIITESMFDLLVDELRRQARTAIGLSVAAIEEDKLASRKSALSRARSVAIAAGCAETSLPVIGSKGDVGKAPDASVVKTAQSAFAEGI